MHVTKMSYYQNVCYRDVLFPKCQVTEMSVTKTSKVSFTKMSGYQYLHRLAPVGTGQ